MTILVTALTTMGIYEVVVNTGKISEAAISIKNVFLSTNKIGLSLLLTLIILVAIVIILKLTIKFNLFDYLKIALYSTKDYLTNRLGEHVKFLNLFYIMILTVVIFAIVYFIIV